MPIYETVLIARQDLNPQQVEKLTTDFTDILKKEGGKVIKTEQWGLRSFAYKINKAKKGHYTLIESDALPAAVHEMERNIRLNEDVVRHLTTRLEAPSKGPSVIIDKNNDSAERISGAVEEEAA
ncbi:MAG: 30S ribosomal protein S6 [Micavibrio aeruginosavorus]|uniref:Small ribosomal subunit protein bS6 n=1 Tax=Micavibrio aeruginosavorus TaxID=349221 RepID=A0A2W5HJX3_9BACT|nr:MAG: 30S ribosomal protein S6 [Micavibrio aeruginosavorus]